MDLGKGISLHLVRATALIAKKDEANSDEGGVLDYFVFIVVVVLLLSLLRRHPVITIAYPPVCSLSTALLTWMKSQFLPFPLSEIQSGSN